MVLNKVILVPLLVFLFIFSGCNSTDSINLPFTVNVPAHFPDPNYPKDNYPTPEKIALGEKLFFDPRLSKNQNISCASCHLPEFAFSDTTKFSQGTDGKESFRNSPSIVNMAYKSLFHKDGGVRTLELQVLSPIIDSLEMDGDFLVILNILSKDQLYVQMFQDAFDTLPSVYGITRAIASYERALVFGNSLYDQYLNGEKKALSSAQVAGLELFNSDKLGCTDCHSGVLFTDFSYQNIGLEHHLNDSGRARITYLPEDAGKFEVPSLRNVSITAPYMHDGSLETLKDVIEYLEHGGGNHPNKSKLISPFKLTTTERENLIAFLESLTDVRFLEK